MRESAMPRWLLLAALLAAVGFTSVRPAFAESVGDPLEAVNRKVFSFNDALDRRLLRPVATGYKRAMPDPLEAAIHNFFTNLGTPLVAANQLLQGKPKAAGQDTARFLVNSTIGLGGLVDIASGYPALPQHQEDFGQTLARWGLPAGPYIVLPLRGPGTVRSVIGSAASGFAYPPRFLPEPAARVGVSALDLVDQRAQLIGADQLIFGERYLFFRDLYLQRRDSQIQDGQVDDPFLDDFE